MIIKPNKIFLKQLNDIVEYIAKDSVNNALKFSNELFNKIEQIPYMPYSYHKNKKLNREDTRELIFKGYVVVFRIKQDNIALLSIFKHNITPFN
ncbi:type II toxin-antitoxin system RelE/ParE family toxin [Campylobacter suis]|uniref:Type II toxin-antitoxin system RelE/ParE family toxin n=1 Tax=Campylobacter suis TaxID=2790657 RepID=A0ABN7KC47_9BACT|nr:type II toxin-antitoxin system RelE/ParE family toxin [Campylobacter suis]CAD7289045.1 hypothetical protein LMG8286_01630 [Campylobacter suis]